MQVGCCQVQLQARDKFGGDFGLTTVNLRGGCILGNSGDANDLRDLQVGVVVVKAA